MRIEPEVEVLGLISALLALLAPGLSLSTPERHLRDVQNERVCQW